MVSQVQGFILRLIGRRSAEPIRVTLLSKPDCPLCQEALEAVVSVYGQKNVNVLNILDDRALEDMYVFRIPVLMRDDVVLAEGRIDRQAARNTRARAVEGSRKG